MKKYFIFVAILIIISIPLGIHMLEKRETEDLELDEKFTCGSVFLDERDNEGYITVKIGNQCWMGENLRYTGNGCLYDENIFSSCFTHTTLWGTEVLYQWRALMDGSTEEGSQGICPNDWYIPTDDDFKELEIYLGMTEEQVNSNNLGGRGTNQGKQLKDNINWDGTNTSGFKALPTGARSPNNSLYSLGSAGFWWSSTRDHNNIWVRSLDSNNKKISRSYIARDFAFSARCILGK